jgi:hypothetical protein
VAMINSHLSSTESNNFPASDISHTQKFTNFLLRTKYIYMLR